MIRTIVIQPQNVVAFSIIFLSFVIMGNSFINMLLEYSDISVNSLLTAALYSLASIGFVLILILFL